MVAIQKNSVIFLPPNTVHAQQDRSRERLITKTLLSLGTQRQSMAVMEDPPTSPRSAGSTAALTEELRLLFNRGEHESLVLRVEQLLKRKRVFDPAPRNVISAARAASLIHLGRSAEAAVILSELAEQGPNAAAAAAILPVVEYGQHYLAWSTSKGAAESAKAMKALDGDDARRLEAQLLYRSGMFKEAAAVFEILLLKAKAERDEIKKPAATSRWGLASVTGRAKATAPPLTAAELEHLSSLINELSTNCMAALVLDGQMEKATQLRSTLDASYELEYNTACALIAVKDFVTAEVCLQNAEALLRADLDEEEDDVERAVSPIRVQKAYLMHLGGDVAAAEKTYAQIMADRNADAASLAVAANNLTVALGQLAFGKKEASNLKPQQTAESSAVDSKPVLPKEEHDALVEGLKKMRATSGRNVERKLAMNQRRAMARNRAILLVQMRRFDACRAELNKLKSEFPSDPLVPLIEASLVGRQGNVQVAENILESSGDDNVARAARVQLISSTGDQKKAAVLLQQFFPSQPAAIVTAARLLEDAGDANGAMDILKKLVASSANDGATAARSALAETLLRNAKYEEAAEVLHIVCKSDPTNSVAQANLVVACSYFDAKGAEEAALLLPAPSTLNTGEVNAEQLEALPPPRRKTIAARKEVSKDDLAKDEADERAARAAAARERKKKKRKKRLPKNYDPDGPPPDPERWLPKTLRSGYKKKKPKNERNNFRGSQGADAAATEAAAVKNAERSAARAAGSSTGNGPLPPSGRRNQRKKKNRR